MDIRHLLAALDYGPLDGPTALHNGLLLYLVLRWYGLAM